MSGVPATCLDTKQEALVDLFAAMEELRDPESTKEVKAGAKKYKYAPLDEFLPGFRNILRKHNFFLTFSIVNTQLGQVMMAVVIHKNGEEFDSAFPMVGWDKDPQSAGSAATYARRYAILNLLGLVADGDDDGESASKPKVPTKTAEQIAADRKTETPEQTATRQENHDPSWEAGKGKFFGQLKDIGITSYDKLLAFTYWLKEEKDVGSGKKPSDMDEKARGVFIRFLKSEKGAALWAEFIGANDDLPPLDEDIPF